MFEKGSCAESVRDFYRREEERSLPAEIAEKYFGSQRLLLEKSLDLSYFESRGLLYSLANLVYKMRTELPRYDLIIGDDVSARLFTRFVRSAVNVARERDGLSRVKVRFVCAGGADNEEQKIERMKFAREKVDFSCRRALFATEYILTGGGIYDILRQLCEQKISFDAAAVSARFKPEFVDNRGEIKIRPTDVEKRKFFFGSFGDDGLAFYKHPANGVVKDGRLPHAVRASYADGQEMKATRRVMESVAREITTKLLDLGK